MMYKKSDLAADIERLLAGGFDVDKISRGVFEIYHRQPLEFSGDIRGIVFMLISMSDGPELELTEDELVSLVEELKSS